jgi:hypothetical protein
MTLVKFFLDIDPFFPIDVPSLEGGDPRGDKLVAAVVAFDVAVKLAKLEQLGCSLVLLTKQPDLSHLRLVYHYLIKKIGPERVVEIQVTGLASSPQQSKQAVNRSWENAMGDPGCLQIVSNNKQTDFSEHPSHKFIHLPMGDLSSGQENTWTKWTQLAVSQCDFKKTRALAASYALSEPSFAESLYLWLAGQGHYVVSALRKIEQSLPSAVVNTDCHQLMAIHGKKSQSAFNLKNCAWLLAVTTVVVPLVYYFRLFSRGNILSSLKEVSNPSDAIKELLNLKL